MLKNQKANKCICKDEIFIDFPGWSLVAPKEVYDTSVWLSPANLKHHLIWNTSIVVTGEIFGDYFTW